MGETLERDLKGVAGADHTIVDKPTAQKHIATGRIDEATRPVAGIVESTTKEREVQRVAGGKTNIVTPAAGTAPEKVETGVVKAKATEVADVVETHTTSRDMHKQ